LLPCSRYLRDLPSFPTRRSSDLAPPGDMSENLVLSDAFEAYKMAGSFYSLTLVPDGWGGIDTVFSGELEAVFRQAVEKYLQVHRSEEHTSELQSPDHLVCRLLLE